MVFLHYENDKLIINGKPTRYAIRLHKRSVSKLPLRSKIDYGHLEPLLLSKPSHIILGTGKYNNVQVSLELRDYIERKGIVLKVVPTSQGVVLYNQCLDGGMQVAGIFAP